MSNINDITPLSDLLATSPHESRESSVHGGSDNETTGPRLRLDLAVRDTTTRTTTDITHDTNGDAIHKDATDADFKSILSHQRTKLSLVDERDTLLKNRSNLKNSIDEVKLKIKYLEDLKQQKLMKRQLAELLEQNDTDISFSGPEISDDTDHIIKNLNVLPSTNWEDRLKLVKKFYPYLELEKIETYNEAEDFPQDVRTILFELSSPLLFKIPLKIHIENISVAKVLIPDSNKLLGKASPLLVTLNLLSPNFTLTLVKNYIPNKKVNLIIYGLNSLSIVLHKRISLLYKLIRKYNAFIANVDKFKKILQPTEIQDNVILFSLLKLVNSVDFLMKKVNIEYVVRLNWDINVDSVLGECESKLNLHIYKKDLTHKEQIIQVNDLFLRLVEEYGVIGSFSIIVRNTFNVVI